MIAVYLRVSAISWRAGKSLTYVRYTACSPLVLILSHQLAQAHQSTVPHTTSPRPCLSYAAHLFNLARENSHLVSQSVAGD